MKLIIHNIDVNMAKKICLLVGRDFKAIEEKEKKKDRQVKEEAELLAEIENEVKKKKPKKK